MHVDPDWTFEEAMRAHKAKVGASDSTTWGPHHPLPQWIAHQELKRFRVAFEGGDNVALMLAIRTCAIHDLVMPEWVATAYCERVNTILSYRAASWDEVLGRPLPKGSQVNALRKRRELKLAVYFEVRKRITPTANSKGAPLDEALFEAVGKEFGLGKTLTGEYYYAAKSLIEGN